MAALVMVGGAGVQTSSGQLIKIPPAQPGPGAAPATPVVPSPATPPATKIEPAPRALLPTAVQVLRDPQGSGIAIYGTLSGKAASASGVLLAIFAHSQAFDPSPELQLLLADKEDRHAQGLFTATVHGAPVTGIAVAGLDDTGGDATVFYDAADAFAASFPRMQQALGQNGGIGTLVLSPIRLGDGRKIGIPPGWRIVAQGGGSVDLQGPVGEFMSLGATLPIYAGDTGLSGDVPQAACCDPLAAFEALYPQVATTDQRLGVPAQTLTGIVETRRLAAAGRSERSLILGNLRVDTEDYTCLALAEAVSGFTDPWTFTLSRASAPQAVFAAEFPALIQIWKSYRAAQPVFGEDVWQALRGMNAAQEMLKLPVAARATGEYNADPGWSPLIATLTGTPAEIGAALGRSSLVPSLAGSLSRSSGRTWRIVPAAEFR